MSWVNTVVAAHSENESPELFFYWSALAALSAAMRKNVYLDRYTAGKLYPNIFVFIVADSGMRKGVPIVMAKNLVKLSGTTRIISGRSSMPAIIRDLGKAYTTEEGSVVRDAQGFILSGELAGFLVKDPDALTILTDLHNTNEHEESWTNSLKTSGIDILKRPCLTLLGATNEEHFPDAVPLNAIGGGFIARTFIVYATEGGIPNPQTDKPLVEVDTKGLSDYLRDISRAKGEFVLSPAGKLAFDDWYYEHRKHPQRDTTGTMNRLDSQVLKVAMLLSLSSGGSLIIEEDHILESIAVCKSCVIGMKAVTLGSGKSSTSYQLRFVLRELMNSPEQKVSRTSLLQHGWGDFDAFDLDKVIETLLGAGAIEIDHAGQKAIYKLKKGVYDEYSQFKRAIM